MRLLDKKVRKVMGMRTDTPDMAEALDALAGFYGQRAGGNTLEARRALRSDLEWQALSVSNTFLKQFEEIESRFEQAAGVVEEVQEACSSMRGRLRATEEETEAFVSRVQALQAEHARLSSREEAVKSFLDAFELSDDEQRALQDAPLEADGGRAFFAALDRLDAVRARCEELLGGTAQSAAVDVVERVSVQQEAAMERLFHWVQDKAAAVEEEGEDPVAGAITPLLAEAVRYLRARPRFYEHCRESVASVRRSALVRRFVLALTRGGPGGTPRPIELGAHDPLRYAGDVLAWVHQATVSEREFLRAVFGADADRPDRAPETEEEEEEEEEEEDEEGEGGRSLLASVLDGLIRPLHVRLAQVLASEPGPVAVFRLQGVLAFYASTLRALVPGTRTIADEVASLSSDADQRFHAALRARADALMAAPPTPPPDLAPPHAVTDAASRLCDILVAHRDAMDGAHREAVDAPAVVDAVLQPLLHVLRAAATSALSREDGAIFLINSANALRAALSAHAPAASWVQRLAAECDEQVDALVAATVDSVLDRSGAAAALRAARAAADELAAVDRGEAEAAAYQPLARQEGSGAEQEEMARAVQSFSATLFSMRLPTFDRVLAPRHRVQARTRVASAAAEAYAALHAAVTEPRNEYAGAESLAPHSPAQVRVLLEAE